MRVISTQKSHSISVAPHGQFSFFFCCIRPHKGRSNPPPTPQKRKNQSGAAMSVSDPLTSTLNFSAQSARSGSRWTRHAQHAFASSSICQIHLPRTVLFGWTAAPQNGATGNVTRRCRRTGNVQYACAASGQSAVFTAHASGAACGTVGPSSQWQRQTSDEVFFFLVIGHCAVACLKLDVCVARGSQQVLRLCCFHTGCVTHCVCTNHRVLHHHFYMKWHPGQNPKVKRKSVARVQGSRTPQL